MTPSNGNVVLRLQFLVQPATKTLSKWRHFHFCDEVSFMLHHFPDSNVHGANMGPTWVLSAPAGPHVGPMNIAIRDGYIHTNDHNHTLVTVPQPVTALIWSFSKEMNRITINAELLYVFKVCSNNIMPAVERLAMISYPCGLELIFNHSSQNYSEFLGSG